MIHFIIFAETAASILPSSYPSLLIFTPEAAVSPSRYLCSKAAKLHLKEVLRGVAL
jgi:hypothetical protein